MIPAEAVEVAALALSSRNGERFDVMARAALEAAAPHMVQAAYYLGLEHGANQPTNPYRSGNE